VDGYSIWADAKFSRRHRSGPPRRHDVVAELRLALVDDRPVGKMSNDLGHPLS